MIIFYYLIFLVLPTLYIDSCLCDCCWNFLIKTYKFNEKEKRRGISLNSNDAITADGEEIKMTNIVHFNSTKKTNYSKKNKRRRKQLIKCSVLNYPIKTDLHPISYDECTKIKLIFTKFDFCSVSVVFKC